ncbi:hypothetical protein SLS62_010300 [Diatrype stigma]|uniref:Cerato-platanin n=1 Tax=Diatrype stigma TaxID=117547 RepID=A0AAN9YGV3_9PEZI
MRWSFTPSPGRLLPLLLTTALLIRTSSQADTDTDTDNSNSGSGTIWATPHEQYSSSAGVLGCKIDTNRVAYWPGSVDCNNICVTVSYAGRSVTLLRVDTSQGAHDISYDAWNYLYTGSSAADQPATGGAVAMTYAYVDPSECAAAGLLHAGAGDKLAFSAPTGTNLLVSCLGAQPDSWVARNYALYNIVDAVCTWGYDEECTLDWPAANQAACPHTLGAMESLAVADPVYNIQYGTGRTVLASTGQVVEGGARSSGSSSGSGSGSGGGGGGGGGGIGIKGLNGAISGTYHQLWSLMGCWVALQCVLVGFL